MSKPITISLQNLNSLYFKFINQFILQYLPKDIYNDVVNLLSLKSAVETYRFLDRLLGEDKKGSEDRKIIDIEETKQGDKKIQVYQEKGFQSNSNQGITSYSTEKQEYRYANQANRIKKPPTLLKRTQTYQSPQKPSNINYESYNFGQARISRQQTSLNKNSHSQNIKQPLGGIKSPLNIHNPILNINVVKHDYDTVSEKVNMIGISSGKRDSSSAKGKEQIRTSLSNGHNEGYSFKGSNGCKEKSDQNLSTSHGNGYKKTEFSKTYSIRETQAKPLTAILPGGDTSSINNSGNNNGTNNNSTPIVVNRLRLQNLIKQTKQIFNENAKKIARYQKISTQIGQKPFKTNQQPIKSNQQPHKSNQDSSMTPFSPQSGNSYTYMYKKY